MKREILKKILLVVFIMQLSAALISKEIEMIRKDNSLIWGYAEGDNSQIRDNTLGELAKSVSEWYLEKTGLAGKISYLMKDKYIRLVKVWLESWDDIQEKSEHKKKYKLIYYISIEEVEEHYKAKRQEVEELIYKGEKYREINKLGLFFRCYYSALVEIDLLAGMNIEIMEESWQAEKIIQSINETIENLAIKIVGNELSINNRRITFHVLYNKRPVNDLRVGFLMGEEYKDYSTSDRYITVDYFGVQNIERPDISIIIDIQDKAVGVWGREIAGLGYITGMDQYEAYRTIPLRKAEFKEMSWVDNKLPIEEKESNADELQKNLQSFNSLLHKPEQDFKGLFAEEDVFLKLSCFWQKYKMRILDLDSRLKREKISGGSIWRGTDIELEYAGGIRSVANLVFETDSEHRISDVYFGMKPIDYRLLSRKAVEGEERVRILEAIKRIEQEYTAGVCGNLVGMEDFPEYDQDWIWTEIDDIKIELYENGLSASYRLTYSGSERSWEFKRNWIEGE